MARTDEHGDHVSSRGLLVAVAVCCAVPMLVIVGATSLLGIAFGPAVAIAVGLVAAGVCVAVMVQHRRSGHQHPTPGTSHGH